MLILLSPKIQRFPIFPHLSLNPHRIIHLFFLPILSLSSLPHNSINSLLLIPPFALNFLSFGPQYFQQFISFILFIRIQSFLHIFFWWKYLNIYQSFYIEPFAFILRIFAIHKILLIFLYISLISLITPFILVMLFAQKFRNFFIANSLHRILSLGRVWGRGGRPCS